MLAPSALLHLTSWAQRLAWGSDQKEGEVFCPRLVQGPWTGRCPGNISPATLQFLPLSPVSHAGTRQYGPETAMSQVHP